MGVFNFFVLNSYTNGEIYSYTEIVRNYFIDCFNSRILNNKCKIKKKEKKILFSDNEVLLNSFKYKIFEFYDEKVILSKKLFNISYEKQFPLNYLIKKFADDNCDDKKSAYILTIIILSLLIYYDEDNFRHNFIERNKEEKFIIYIYCCLLSSEQKKNSHLNC